MRDNVRVVKEDNIFYIKKGTKYFDTSDQKYWVRRYKGFASEEAAKTYIVYGRKEKPIRYFIYLVNRKIKLSLGEHKSVKQLVGYTKRLMSWLEDGLEEDNDK